MCVKNAKCEIKCVRSVKRAVTLLYKSLCLNVNIPNNHRIIYHMLVFFALKMLLLITLKKWKTYGFD